jgi:hypothetical protein
MKIFYYFLLFLLTSYSICCKSNDYSTHNPKAPLLVMKNCPKLTLLIQSDWKKNKSNGLYYYNNKFFPRLKTEFNTCIQRLTKGDIIDLFGKPNQDLNDGSLNYYLNLKCLDNSLGVCYYLTFIYDTENMKVIDFTEWKRRSIQ